MRPRSDTVRCERTAPIVFASSSMRGSCVRKRSAREQRPAGLCAHRFHQVERLHFERVKRMLVVGGDENHRRRVVSLRQVACDLDAVHVRHMHVEKHHVRVQAIGFLETLNPAVGLADQLQRNLFRTIAQHLTQALAPVVRRRRSSRSTSPSCPAPSVQARRSTGIVIVNSNRSASSLRLDLGFQVVDQRQTAAYVRQTDLIAFAFGPLGSNRIADKNLQYEAVLPDSDDDIGAARSFSAP